MKVVRRNRALLVPGQSLTEAVTYIRVIVANWISWQTGPQDLQTHAWNTTLS